MDAAFTRQEIEAAEQAMRQHLATYPEDVRREPWHGWDSTVFAATERHQQALNLGLTSAQEEQRENLLRASYVSGDYISDPRVLPQMQAALTGLSRWLLQHPDDRFASERHTSVSEDVELAEQAIAALQQSRHALATV